MLTKIGAKRIVPDADWAEPPDLPNYFGRFVKSRANLLLTVPAIVLGLAAQAVFAVLLLGFETALFCVETLRATRRG